MDEQAYLIVIKQLNDENLNLKFENAQLRAELMKLGGEDNGIEVSDPNAE